MHLAAQKRQHTQHEDFTLCVRPNAASGGPTSEMTVPLGSEFRAFLQRFARKSTQHGIVVPQHLFNLLLVVSITTSAPRLCTNSAFPALVVVATLAPRCFASWIANVPMPPEPAGTNNFWPGWRCARSFSACHAVSPTIGMEAACAKSNFAGFSTATLSGTAANSARAPVRSPKMLATTASPGLNRVTSRPTSTTTPAKSLPTVAGN